MLSIKLSVTNCWKASRGESGTVNVGQMGCVNALIETEVNVELQQGGAELGTGTGTGTGTGELSTGTSTGVGTWSETTTESL